MRETGANGKDALNKYKFFNPASLIEVDPRLIDLRLFRLATSF
jgi:hypothetical protein